MCSTVIKSEREERNQFLKQRSIVSVGILCDSEGDLQTQIAKTILNVSAHIASNFCSSETIRNLIPPIKIVHQLLSSFVVRSSISVIFFVAKLDNYEAHAVCFFIPFASIVW